MPSTISANVSSGSKNRLIVAAGAPLSGAWRDEYVDSWIRCGRRCAHPRRNGSASGTARTRRATRTARRAARRRACPGASALKSAQEVVGLRQAHVVLEVERRLRARPHDVGHRPAIQREAGERASRHSTIPVHGDSEATTAPPLSRGRALRTAQAPVVTGVQHQDTQVVAGAGVFRACSAIRRSGRPCKPGSSPAAASRSRAETLGQRLAPALDEAVGVHDQRLRAGEYAGVVGPGARDEPERRVDLPVDRRLAPPCARPSPAADARHSPTCRRPTPARTTASQHVAKPSIVPTSRSARSRISAGDAALVRVPRGSRSGRGSSGRSRRRRARRRHRPR